MKLTARNENITLFSDKSQVIITKNRGIATKHLYPMEFIKLKLEVKGNFYENQ